MMDRLWKFAWVSSVALSVACGSEPQQGAPADASANAALADSFIDGADWRMAPDSVALADHRLRLLALEAWTYQQASGRFPEQLADALPDMSTLEGDATTDPWGHRVTYVTTADSAILESAGPDGVHDSNDDIRVVVQATSPFRVRTIE